MMEPAGFSKQYGLPSGSLKSRAKIPLLYLGDVIIFYVALTLTLFIRYGAIDVSGVTFDTHVEPFSVALILWLLLFYIGGLYERQIFNRDVLIRRFFSLVGIGGIILILLFYFVPSFGIAPKANLFLFIGIFAAAGYAWRSSFNTLLRERAGNFKNRVLLIGSSKSAHEVEAYIRQTPHAGYELVLWLTEGLRSGQNPEQFTAHILERGINTIVVPGHIDHDPGALRMLYYAFMSGVQVISLADFYERLFDKVSIAELEDSWLIKNLPQVARRGAALRYGIEATGACVLLVLFSPLMLLATIAIALTSSGPIIYRQIRLGQHEKPFSLYKFRSMYAEKSKNPDADAAAPTWSTENDPRVTPVGRFLRASHIDEFPQLFNVLRGEMSFVGPRPERPEFTAQLEKSIPYYELRYLLRPGITGWAQINYPYGASIEDAYQKLQYEIYYLKNRSVTLDIAIILRTIKNFFVAATS
jgi:exopolysaccharide biosynthesis polyprenyl glycosylphosphotransferase